MTGDIQTKGNEIADGYTDAVFKSRQLPQTFTWYQIRDLAAAAVAERDKEWGSGICSAHQIPSPVCRLCNLMLDIENIAKDNIKVEREKLIKEADARAKRYTDKDDRWGAGYTCAMQQFAAAMRQEVKP